ncbi:ABC transporter ATP-binding protein [Dongia sedimenti]|uniref:ATP-binding cassette domain-containing protein n=1 Tax=Dongia sedimenti TaxID=3064282 RepID=A0ABU0YIW7_9PROT|nr:ATP-binding cassette domain-containing protein [Rhodospirillaceae bacterium R-7]
MAAPRTSAGALLSVEDLKVHFPIKGGVLGTTFAHVRAVDGVSFELKSGETLGIVGESGCGKSTLGRAVLRLIKATDGRVVWAGQDLFGLGAKALRDERRQMQIIFQDPLASLDPRMSVETIIGKPLRIFHPELSRAEVRRRVFETMNQVGLAASMANRYPHEFSGGQCQRIGIARAIILKPKLIVCDEPVSALDVSIQAQIINLLMELQRSLGVSLLFISHNLAVVRHISHRVMVLYLGKIMEIAERDDFYARPLHPYSQALISAVPIADPRLERGRPRLLLQGDIPSPINPPSGCRFRTRCPKATAICSEQEPAMRDYGVGHFAACHHIGE